MGSSSIPVLLFPWLTLVSIIWLQSINGTNSVFPDYSSQLKSRLKISQVKLNYLTVASDAGKLFGWCSGVAARHLPLWLALMIGAIIGSVGYGVQFLFLASKIASLAYWQAFLLCVLAGNSVCWINTVCYIAAMRKFPVDHGTVVCLATSYAALSAKIYIAMTQVILGGDPSDKSIYLLLNSIVPILTGAITSPFLKESKPAGPKTRAGLVTILVIAGVTGSYAVVETAAPVFGSMPRRLPPLILLVMVVLLIIFVPLVNVIEWIKEGSWSLAREGEGVEKSVIKVEDKEVDREGGAGCGEEERWETWVRREYRVRELVASMEFWLYFLVYGCGGTLGLVYANNLGQISRSRGISDTVLVSISSSFSFFGKLFSAPLSAFSSRHMVSRPASMVLLMIPMAASFFLLLNPTKACLFIGTAIIGMCTGAMTSIAVSVTSELFGSEHFGVNHNILIANIPLGSLLFGYIAAFIYDKEGGGGYGPCIGTQCYHKTFIIWGFFCSLGTILSFVLYIQTKKWSKKRESGC
ncbi:protein NUCLEAR FUSION DEFECTIVE 4-like isoform X1 [Phoenix dactylifera]|uniref:Protein NUCLEAR FUSION DEFECTIVE 4-like isoform X1 n=1 Tax=Phoenix dactylifera TaxID=42345 RepID=A0A8B7CIE4_PHODC|nr:protein NUCLEAR FUSION DEFECTIVE 4-like isoform X1 [Phoenix dactylifera]